MNRKPLVFANGFFRFWNYLNIYIVVKVLQCFFPMKRFIIVAVISIFFLGLSALLVLHFWISGDVKANIELVQKKYGGTPEEALIAYLQDDTNSKADQTHIAVWTLGQLESEMALPVLNELYKNDPKGETCFEHHHSMICQYELHKAIKSIEKGQLFSYSKFKK